jgi:DNA-binding NarL/FixJ family response regulator
MRVWFMAAQRARQENTDKPRKPIRILLADDHKILRASLRELLENQPCLEIVAEADQGKKAVQLCLKHSPDIALMDISMPDLNGIEATRQITNRCAKTKVIILSAHSDHHFVTDVFKAGASGYLLKDCDTDDLLSAIRIVASGETYLCPRIATIVRDEYLHVLMGKESAASSILTVREREVLQLIAEGKSAKEIAFSCNLSVKTIEAHRQRIMAKLNIHSVAELTKYAIREGLTSLES